MDYTSQKIEKNKRKCSTWIVHQFLDGRRCEHTTVSVQPERRVEQDVDKNSDIIPKIREKPETARITIKQK